MAVQDATIRPSGWFSCNFPCICCDSITFQPRFGAHQNELHSRLGQSPWIKVQNKFWCLPPLLSAFHIRVKLLFSSLNWRTLVTRYFPEAGSSMRKKKTFFFLFSLKPDISQANALYLSFPHAESKGEKPLQTLMIRFHMIFSSEFILRTTSALFFISRKLTFLKQCNTTFTR